MLIFGQNEMKDSVEWKVRVFVVCAPVEGEKPEEDVLDLKRKKKYLQTLGFGTDT